MQFSFDKKVVRQGFTIVELLIVVVIIGILASLVAVTYNGVSQNAKESSRKSDYIQAKKQIEAFYALNGFYPDANNCPTPGQREICLKTSPGNTLSYSPNNLVTPPYDLTVIQTVAAQSIVASGLVLNVDAGNTSSYPGTGTTWTDLTGLGNNLTLINSPTWNSAGYFSTGSTGYFTGAGSASIPIGNSSYTLIVWARQNSSWGSARGLISIGGFWSVNQSNALRTASNTSVGNFEHYWWGNDMTVSNNNAGLLVGTWFMVTAQYDGTTRRVWANTTNVASDTPVGHNVASSTVQVGKTYSTEYFQGDIAVAQIYNRALSSSEITQNYNYYRSRFGL